MSFADPGWVVVVPVKHSSVAKSRLANLSARARAVLARAFPLDCVAAGLSSSAVAHVLVVTDDATVAATVRDLGASVVADEPDSGLNPALIHGCTHAREHWGDTPVAALSGDLPSLRAAELTGALSMAVVHKRAFVSDAAGTGTTMLTAGRGVELEPQFGTGSADAHRSSGAIELDASELVTVRRDVDTEMDLRDALGLGVGGHTRRALQDLGVVL
ncbi:MAG: 2-phospho-L-lactate guanylyltransferase [Propionibacteriales bacterium]|nr:2-phospho-L-lactate guanylyltransferase [Propionibacteriales bacterium]